LCSKTTPCNPRPPLEVHHVLADRHTRGNAQLQQPDPAAAAVEIDSVQPLSSTAQNLRQTSNHREEAEKLNVKIVNRSITDSKEPYLKKTDGTTNTEENLYESTLARRNEGVLL